MTRWLAPLLVALVTLPRVALADDAPPRSRRVTFTVDVFQLASSGPMAQLTSEVRVARAWSLALAVGYGARAIDAPFAPDVTTVRAWQAGVEPRWYWIGRFDTGFYAGWSTTFVRARGGPIGFESAAPPPGLASGAFLGFKSADVPIITPDIAFGLMVPLVTPSTEARPPPVAFVVRFGIGFSL